MLLLFTIDDNDSTVMNSTKRVAPKVGDIIDVKYTKDGVVVPKRLASRVRVTDIATNEDNVLCYVAQKL